ncbi:rho GTPase-activating protein 24-like protein [Willisornis vidua]|uniref:Rho GTPase-activating protein 24-like protein n=1 Tax=Willisornis vidua TaxID=1566151 RepID=A0ABQ9DHV2_9PASS|nr:rho GTPase-activating protein 24-like protein [Willisornis vidua]
MTNQPPTSLLMAAVPGLLPLHNVPVEISLEQQHRALQLEIQGMHWRLGQQREWHRLVERRMRNAERAKEDAERRNETLQKEMEEFFETFGEINRWK